jgi:ATP-dependent Lhr-like helicase
MHHGDLSKQIRRESELFMKECHVGVCISTMTLEIGIDIGNVDAVLLAETPLNISSFLQRIGRGNRRSIQIKYSAFMEMKMKKYFFKI